MGCRGALRGDVRVGGVPILVVLGNEDPDDDSEDGAPPPLCAMVMALW